jgi:hypothetical protein
VNCILHLGLLRPAGSLLVNQDLLSIGPLPPLRTIDEWRLISLSDAANMREAEVHLTESGKDVLAGRLNFVTVNGIDDWVCGIHLDSVAGHVWFQRNGILVDNQ